MVEHMLCHLAAAPTTVIFILRVIHLEAFFALPICSEDDSHTMNFSPFDRLSEL
jgi:hypothetical protein